MACGGAQRRRLDPDTDQPLTSWEDAVRALDDDGAGPLHLGRFGRQVDAKGVMAASPDSDRCVGYITKYLVKDIAECHEQGTPAEADHADRLLAPSVAPTAKKKARSMIGTGL